MSGFTSRDSSVSSSVLSSEPDAFATAGIVKVKEIPLTVAPCDKEIPKAMGATFKKPEMKWYVKSDNINYLAGRFER